MAQLPTLARCADRTYILTTPFNIGALRSYLESLGFRHTSPRSGDLFQHRWRSPDGQSILTMFSSGRIVCLGPAVSLLDELCEAVAEVAR